MEKRDAHGGAYAKFPDGLQAYREVALDVTLQELYQSAIRHAEDRLSWYDQKSSSVARFARRLRFGSLLLFVCGTLSPLMFSFFNKLDAAYLNHPRIHNLAIFPWTEVGIVLLAMAGALVIFDQFFDWSGSWMRYRQAEARINVMLAELRYTWAEQLAHARGVIGADVDPSTFIESLKIFVKTLEQFAEAETREWAERFRAAIQKFDSDPNLKLKLGDKKGDDTTPNTPGGQKDGQTKPADNGTPGQNNARSPEAVTVRLAIPGAPDFEPGSLAVTVNDTPVTVPSSGFIELSLELGVTHHITGSARKAGSPVQGSLTIEPTAEHDLKPLALELA